MMNDTSSDNGRNLEARVTEAGAALGERVQSATAATAAAAGQAQKIVEGAAAATAAAADQAKKVLSDAGGVAQDVVDAGRRATRSVSRQIDERPLIAALVGFALGYVASLWIHGRGRPERTADDNAKAEGSSP
jgi:hypothetical protein